MKNYYVYIVECNDLSFYSGVTSNIEKRIAEHNFGVDIDSYTYFRRPVRIVFSQHFSNIDDALRAEKQIKGWSRKKKLALINGDFDLLKELSRCQNETSSYKRDITDLKEKLGS
ncbi:MAG: GIY-YIG nuclease family protein [Candidatus Kapabacteria bacterium]|nr:GIY-YIG nuclease family protein [Ignavibacteriota bacterium]MCW5884574.1 GIY-YIG nuclease family protein [Candidatus Kapabacteria bacterium]